MEELVELPEGDISPLLPFVERAAFINIRPGVDIELLPERGVLGQVLGNRGPTVPLATWTPGEIGLLHAIGQRARTYLAERGVDIPDEWYVASDHPKRGLVLKTYQTAPEVTLRWLVRAATVTCPLPIEGPWGAVVHTR